MRNIQSLDGLRAISIALVIVGHLCSGLSLQRHYLTEILGNSHLGVEVFFVISGYLITHLLLKEFDQDGTFSLRMFYLRRAFRILPPYYFYLLAICVVAALGFLTVTPLQRASAFLFLWDYLPAKYSNWSLEHLWSLSVEEQFYLLWPAALLLSLRKSRTRARQVAIACLLAAPALRLITYFAHSTYSAQMYSMLHTRMDALMFGCIAALSRGQAWFERIYTFFARYVFVLIGFIWIVSPILTFKLGGAYIYTVGFSLEGFCIMVAMLWAIRNPETRFGRFLNWTPMKTVGVMSYSMYLWQTVFLHPLNHSILGRFPLNLALILVCAAFSYYVIETPTLRFRAWLTRRMRRPVPALAGAPLERRLAEKPIELAEIGAGSAKMAVREDA